MNTKKQTGTALQARRKAGGIIIGLTAASSTGIAGAVSTSGQKQAFSLLTLGHPSLFVIIAFLVTLSAAAISWGLSRQRAMKKLKRETREKLIANDLKSKYIKILAHEFRGPLNGIIGISEFMADNTSDPDTRQKSDVILRSGNDLMSLVENIHYMTLLETGELEVKSRNIELIPVLERMARQWRSIITDPNIAFTYHIDPSVPDHMTIDANKLTHCVNHLMANAVKFTEKGRIHIHITAENDAGSDTVLQVVVADTGQGINPDSLDRIFRPYSQMDERETRSFGRPGLGLAITKKLARLLGGDVTVNSKLGRGTEFILTVTGPSDHAEDLTGSEPETPVEATILPVDGIMSVDDAKAEPISEPEPIAEADLEVEMDPIDPPETETESEPVSQERVADDHFVDVDTAVIDTDDDYALLEAIEINLDDEPVPGAIEAEAFEPASSREPDSRQTYRVLVVEDDLAGQNVVRSLLEPAGCKIACVPNGNFALQALQEHLFDFIIMDIRMPSMNGVETARIIRNGQKPYADIPIIATTADVSPETRTHCLAVGMDAFLTKPLIARNLFATIDDVMHGEKKRETA